MMHETGFNTVNLSSCLNAVMKNIMNKQKYLFYIYYKMMFMSRFLSSPR